MRYTDEVQAQAAADDLKVQGYYDAKVKKYGGIYLVDKGSKGEKESLQDLNTEEVKELKEELKEMRKQSQPRQSNGGMRMMRSVVKGLDAFNQNIKDPKKRLKIARTPNSRSEIPICQTTVKSRLAPQSAGIKRGNISYVQKKS